MSFVPSDLDIFYIHVLKACKVCVAKYTFKFKLTGLLGSIETVPQDLY